MAEPTPTQLGIEMVKEKERRDKKKKSRVKRIQLERRQRALEGCVAGALQAA